MKRYRIFQFLLPLGFILFIIVLFILAISPLDKATIINCPEGITSICFGLYSRTLITIMGSGGIFLQQIITLLLGLDIANTNLEVFVTLADVIVFFLYLALLFLLGRFIDKHIIKR